MVMTRPGRAGGRASPVPQESLPQVIPGGVSTRAALRAATPLFEADRCALARRARCLEREALEALAGHEVARVVLEQPSRFAERTYAAGLQRLATATDALEHAACTPAERATLAHVRGLLEQRRALHWQLAFSEGRIVFGEARKLVHHHLSEDDLQQEGWIGLYRAAQRFDPDRGIRFSTFACWWVRMAMFRAIEEIGQTIRVPSCALELSAKLRRLLDATTETGGHTLAEAAALAGTTEARAAEVLNARDPMSLDAPQRDSRGDEFQSPEDHLLGWAAREHFEEAEADAERLRLLARVEHAISTILNPRERFVVERHWGLDGLLPETFTELSHASSSQRPLTRQRVHQIHEGAMERLRAAFHGQQAEIAEVLR